MPIFILFSQQRSGMGALASFITQHPGIKNVTEILNPYSVEDEDNFFGYWVRHDPVAMIKSARSPSDLFIEYLNQLEEKYKDIKILLDIKLNSIRHVLNYWEELPGFTEVGMPWLLYLFKSRGYPALYLHRENHLHRFVSSKMADITGVYRTADASSIGRGKIELDIDEMHEFIFKAERSHERFVEQFGQFSRNLYLEYENIFRRNKLTSDTKLDLARFVGFQLLPGAEPYYIKLRKEKLENVVINYGQVCEALNRLERTHYIRG